MATTGTALIPGTSTFPNTNVYPGQGSQPLARCRVSFDENSVSPPSWTEVANNRFRSFDISRGRENELQNFDAGTATVVLDNRDRAYDPAVHAYIRPMNRVWLYEEFSGEVHDLFRGYVESWTEGWPGWGGSDAVVTLACSDESKPLGLEMLPTTDPLRGSYSEVVAFDQPLGYWRFNDEVDPLVQTPVEVEPNPGSPGPLRPRWQDPGFVNPWRRKVRRGASLQRP